MSAPIKEKENEKDEELNASVQFSAQYISGQAEITEEQPETADVQPENSAEFNAGTEQAETAQEEMTRRDREILEALDEVLRRNTAEPERKPRQRKPRPDIGRFIIGSTEKGAGMITLALTLIFLGIVTLCVLVSGSGDYMLIAKLSPAAAVFMGLELLLGWFLPKKKLCVNIPCIAITAVIVAGSCILAASLNRSYTEIREERSGRIAADDIYEKSYTVLHHAADILTLSVEVVASPENDGSGELVQGDRVNITIEFDGSYKTPEEFAQECRSVIDAYDSLGIPVMDYHFSAETRQTAFRLDVEGLFQQDRNASELAELVNYYYIEDFDYIPDIEDVTEEITAEETSE